MKNYTANEILEKNLKVEGNNRNAITYNGIFDIIRKIYINEGITGFYKGIVPNQLRIFPTAGLFFLSYEYTLLLLEKNF